MNKLTTALLGLTLMAGSAAFAQTATDATAPAATGTKAATATPKAHKVKKHTKKSTDATTPASTSATNPTK
jgi:hypothetical protein